MNTTPIRDDNLVLIFAAPAKAEIIERLNAVVSGARLVVAFIAATMLLWIAYFISGGMNAFTSVVLWICSVIVFASPLIFAILAVEYRRARRDEAELLALLKRYNRS